MRGHPWFLWRRQSPAVIAGNAGDLRTLPWRRGYSVPAGAGVNGSASITFGALSVSATGAVAIVGMAQIQLGSIVLVANNLEFTEFVYGTVRGTSPAGRIRNKAHTGQARGI